MRGRLIAVFTIPIAALFIVLGVAYARSLAYAGQQELYLDRLGDASQFVVGARQAFGADDSGRIAAELDRYGEVFGIGAAVLDRSGATWASNGLDVTGFDEVNLQAVHTALAGRSSRTQGGLVPWSDWELVVAEPVFDSGDLIGVVVTSSGTERLARETARQWLVLAIGGVLAIAASVLVASRLARWVLRPVHQVDAAMTEIWHGHTDARIAEVSGPPELRRVTAVFNGMAAKVEHLVEKQQEFVSNASHELRNPLNALLLRVEDLDLSLGGQAASEVEHVREEGRRMARILDALLMLARDQDLTAGSSPVEIGLLVRGRLDAWRPIAREAGVETTLCAPGELWCEVDPIVIESAFDAVIDNAVKFAPFGSVVEVIVAEPDGRVEVTVRDHGAGLPPEEASRVADRFWRSPVHQNERGAGLGLAIATEFLTSCGGGLRASAADGGGLAVSLWVPRRLAPR